MSNNRIMGLNNARELLDVLIRAGLIAVLVMFCFQIFHPFMNIVLWSVILAITLYPLNQKLAATLGDRHGLAAVIVVILGLACLIVPMGLLGASIADSVQANMHTMQGRTFEIPPPPAVVQTWPLIGEPLFSLWTHASENLSWVFSQIAPHLKDLSRTVLTRLAGAGAGIMVFVLALFISGLIMAHGDSGQRTALAIATRISGPEHGPGLASLCTATIRAVAQGVVGVAFIQMVLVGIGLVVMGVPGAGVLALLVLLVGIIQLPTLLIITPVVLYVFFRDGVGVSSIIFTVWLVLAGLSDNVLKPLMLGRGVAVPMPIILIGALGGMLSSGIIGLFIGPVLLAMGYQLFMSWVYQPPPVTTSESGTADPGKPLD
ncbi:AI-2E family transporter [Pseudomonas sp. NPDC087697]|uniref:AI-2E family transporter n=1 Tax=Pseudomonas sp. NPDC087697 TaxID=3364447 RepID=UPI003821E3A0